MENKKKLAIYPGSFNPFTIGHLNILEKAEDLFGKENVIIAIGENKPKERNSTNEFAARLQNIKNNLPSRKIEQYNGMLTDFVGEKEQEGFDVTIIRGLRDSDDLGYERTQLKFMQEMKPNLKVVFFLCDKEFEHISSSAYRALEATKPGSGHRYLAKEINKWFVVLEGDKYNTIEDVPKNKIDLCSKIKVFKGYELECATWMKLIPASEAVFKPENYTLGIPVSYDREVMTLLSINEHRCVLKFQESEIKVERYSAPDIWVKYKKA